MGEFGEFWRDLEGSGRRLSSDRFGKLYKQLEVSGGTDEMPLLSWEYHLSFFSPQYLLHFNLVRNARKGAKEAPE